MNLERPGPIMCFGEVLARLSPPAGTRLSLASNLFVHIGGAEANVAAVLAQLGRPTEMITRLPNSTLGDLSLFELRRSGIGIRHVERGGGRLGLYFFEPGSGRRPAEVTYDRAGSLFAEAPDPFDWSSLAREAAWFHLSGINLALSEGRAAEAVIASAAMRAEGVPISFDVNYRPSLWRGLASSSTDMIEDLISVADMLFASPTDLARVLQTEVAATSEQRRAVAEAAFARFSHLSLIACTLRSGAGAADLALSARLDDRQRWHETEATELGAVVDRIGSGDAFAGALVDSMLSKSPLEKAAQAGLAAAVLKHSISGDRWFGSRDDLQSFDPGHWTDVQR